MCDRLNSTSLSYEKKTICNQEWLIGRFGDTCLSCIEPNRHNLYSFYIFSFSVYIEMSSYITRYKALVQNPLLTYRYCFPLYFIRPAGVVSKGTYHSSHVYVEGIFKWFSIVQCFKTLWLEIHFIYPLCTAC